MLIRSTVACLAAGALLASAAPPAAGAATIEGVQLPERLSVGGQQLQLRGCGVRSEFFMNLYVAGLYLPQANMRQDDILSADTAKAVRLQIVYDGSLPQDVPDSWREPLQEMARAEIEKAVKDIYRKFQSGDQVTLTYAPNAGTRITINGKEIRDTDGNDLIQPLLRLWIGDRAVSPNLRQLMLSGKCGGGGEGWF